MNILLASKIFVDSGVGNHILILANQFTNSGHNVFIVSSNNTHKTELEEKNIEFIPNSFNISNPVNFIRCCNRHDLLSCN